MTKKKKAINGIKEYLIELLEQEKWCDAERVGGILKTLVSLPVGPPPPLPPQFVGLR